MPVGTLLGGRVITAALVAALVAAGCGPSAVASPEAGTPLVATLGPPAASASGGPSTAAAASGVLHVDAGLLAVLPQSVDGVPITESPEVDADVAGNTSLAGIAESAIGAVAVDTGSSDLVTAIVVKLRAGALDDDAFRNWRDRYDTGACDGSGVVGHAEAQIAGHQTFIGTCGSGLRTYHVWLADRSTLVSAGSLGARRLGESLIAGLR
jgi:hypothetical protein